MVAVSLLSLLQLSPTELAEAFVSRVVEEAMFPDSSPSIVLPTVEGAYLDIIGNVVVETALWTFVAGDVERAGRLLRASFETELMRLAVDRLRSRPDRKGAAKRRRQDGLQREIARVLCEYPQANTAEVLAELRKAAGGRVIDAVDDEAGIVEWRDRRNPAGLSPISGLKHRVARERKALGKERRA